MCDSKSFCILFMLFLFTTFAFSTLSKIHKCHKHQSEALLLFKHNLSSINYTTGNYQDYKCEIWLGPDYHPIMMTWNASTDCCNWNGVTCNYSTGDVIGIDVSCGMLSGTIHPNSSLFNLPHLQRLNLAFNYFSEQLPGDIRRFSNSLTHLNISFNQFSGQVPTDITLLSKLVSLDLAENLFDLRLHVLNNMFQNFTNLEKISLAFADISSVFPTSLNISSSLKLLDLGYTKLQGKLPHYLFNLHSLEGLYLYGNYFTGNIPSEISLPKSIFNLRHLKYLDLSDNNLNGIFPSQLFTLPSLVHLELRYNMFSGNVPFDSCSPSLKKLILSQNQFVGGIDVKTFRKLTNLIVIDLSFNNFSGEWELDTLFSNVRNLYYLDLSYSGFSVTTNNAIHYVNPGFRYLGLGSCKLKGFPNSVRAMKNLQLLDLSRNEIHGFPHWAEEIGGDNLVVMNLSQNFITSLPEFKWYGLGELYLQFNLIQGPFPQSLCNMSNLLFLDISNNRFGGLIPHCFGKMISDLDMIDMGNNGFQGIIPRLHGDCEWLVGLILNGNQLEGEVPSSLSKCQSLKVFDLGNNHLNGTFPSWLGGLHDLQVLNLKSNNFHGHIQPPSAVEFPFPSLQVLDLSHNEFVGQLPARYFKNFDSMKNVMQNNSKAEYLNMGPNYYSFVVAVKGINQDIPRLFVNLGIIDLSNNNFERGIPEVIGNLRSLKVLNLSHNSLNGRIPDSLGKLVEIESLDLSWNQLTGNIPQSLSGIKRLAVLNLSQNHLVGRIPEGTQFNTFDESSFAGNLGLCGFPLPKKCTERTHKPQLEEHENHEVGNGFTWKVVTLGYGCGTLLGLVMGYLMLSTRKVKWFNVIADAGKQMVLDRNKRRYVFIGK